MLDDRSACADHTKCPAGQGSNWNTLSPANQHESACAACSSTTFSNIEDYGPCDVRSTTCPAGQRFIAGGVNADRTCAECTSG
jgi:hypothetical protein